MSKEWYDLWKDYENYERETKKLLDINKWKKSDPYPYEDDNSLNKWKDPYDWKEIDRILEEAEAEKSKETQKRTQKKELLQTEIIEKLQKLFDRILQYGRSSGFYVSETLSDAEFVGYCRGIVTEGGKLTKDQFERLNGIWKKYKEK